MKRKTKILVLVLALTLSMVDTMYSQIFVAGNSDSPRSKSEFFSGYQGGMTREGSFDDDDPEDPNPDPNPDHPGDDAPIEGYTFLGSGAAALVGFAVLFLIAKRKKKGSSEPK